MAKINRNWSNKYDIVDAQFNAGGNGSVSRVREKESGRILVLKELYNDNREKRARFIEEIDIMYNNYKTIDGVMPVYDYSKEEYWYVMPEAELLINYIKRCELGFDDRLGLVILYAEILKELHENGIKHRDIKPLNLYILDGKAYFGDFGLADFPDNDNDFTKSDKGLGAIFTIAPEMKRDPKHADAKKADVYSFAKTIWMVFTEDEKGFEGQYNRLDPTMAIADLEKYKNIHLSELEDLLTISTDNNPDNRPTMEQFLVKLKDFQRIKVDYYQAQVSDWKAISKQIFLGDNEPSSCSWEELDKIVSILNIIGSNPAYNHMFFSSKGGMDFTKAKKAAEKGCIEIYTGDFTPDIVKPKQLIYQGFDENSKWNYFLLELDDLEPIEPMKWDGYEYERLVEDKPGHYVASDYWQYGVYDYDSGEKFPDGWKLVRRYKRGKLLFTLKTGIYNAIGATYDGRHAMCSSDTFKKYIQEMISAEKKFREMGINVWDAMDRHFSRNPFKDNTLEKNDNEGDDTGKIVDAYKFIRDNYASWEFFEEEISNHDSKIRYKFVFDEKGGHHRLGEERKEIVLSKDGRFKENIKDDDIMWVYDRAEALKFEEDLYSFLEEKCNSNGCEFPEDRPFINIEIGKNGMPKHLFSFEELVTLLKGADDRHNNTVVINENGEVELVSDDERKLYPVRNETFQAGNRYVGKYADVVGVAEDLYPNLLWNWLAYLRTGRARYVDYCQYSMKDVDGLISDINCIMK